ncbi:MAG: hypothetical protein DRQ60_09125 [Gammaproteobacteria bacterium]|nr:MAG: hypothetical protein DRQ60_09125 [Gammaproteobacteria bacterium]
MTYILDIECYVNYFLIMITSETELIMYEKFNDNETVNDLQKIDWSATFVTFNGNNYDMLLLAGAEKGLTNTQLKHMSDRIIVDNLQYWDIEAEFGIKTPVLNHIDIMQVLPMMSSLKIYGGRIGTKKLQDLPIEPDAIIRTGDTQGLAQYCFNDLIVTKELYHEVKPQIELRKQMGEKYGVNLVSKSDAQIAELVIASEHLVMTGTPLFKPDITYRNYYYETPSFVNFTSEQLQDLLLTIELTAFKIKPTTGKIMDPPSMKGKVIAINDMKYKLGLGGLHSVDKPGSFYSDDDHVIFDIDVAAYYPNIILNAKFFPEHIGSDFLSIYKRIVDARMAAKKSGDKVTDASLKIVINGTFGKFGSKYSKIYSPDLLFHVTVTGQLCLLMLIERLGNKVISVNTDGVMVRVAKNELKSVQDIVSGWERETNFDMEWTEYNSLHRRDVNNYMAIQPSGAIKRKGLFTLPGLSKNPSNSIIPEAVTAYFKDRIPIEQTVTHCDDIKKFLTLRTVNGGAEWDGEILGKSVRWYHSILSDKNIHYRTNNNKVPLTNNAIPVMELPAELPWDIDYEWYTNEATKLMEIMK